MYKKNPKLLNQFQYCEKEEVPFIVVVGEGEMAKGGVTLREVASREEVSGGLNLSSTRCRVTITFSLLQQFVKNEELISELLKRLSA